MEVEVVPQIFMVRFCAMGILKLSFMTVISCLNHIIYRLIYRIVFIISRSYHIHMVLYSYRTHIVLYSYLFILSYRIGFISYCVHIVFISHSIVLSWIFFILHTYVLICKSMKSQTMTCYDFKVGIFIAGGQGGNTQRSVQCHLMQPNQRRPCWLRALPGCSRSHHILHWLDRDRQGEWVSGCTEAWATLETF